MYCFSPKAVRFCEKGIDLMKLFLNTKITLMKKHSLLIWTAILVKWNTTLSFLFSFLLYPNKRGEKPHYLLFYSSKKNCELRYTDSLFFERYPCWHDTTRVRVLNMTGTRLFTNRYDRALIAKEKEEREMRQPGHQLQTGEDIDVN